MESNLLEKLSNFYPQQVSPFDTAYNESKESAKREECILQKDENWALFVNNLAGYFGIEYIDDRSENNPSKIIAVYSFNEDKSRILQIVICKSLLIPYYCFYCNELLVNSWDKAKRFFNGRTWNYLPERNAKEEAYIKSLLSKFYSECLLIPEEILFKKVHNMASQSSEIGQATIFNLLFSDDIF